MFPALVLFAASIFWAKYSPNDVISLESRVFYWTMGTTFSNIACRLIVAQMTHTRAPSFNFLLSLYCGVMLIAIVGDVDVSVETRLLQVLAAVITLAHLHYGICLVR
ncbi:unnamed protein product [Anisakis simplex]|uniref:Ethanolaminephosphotransferase 1 (inferred by orthology to a human protein) n=1 Tax=Anisakis simplex TaxID=6269 RepID=A0A0M3JC96_ANISI|nr:unnamed protein product [Anisakis simplex]